MIEVVFTEAEVLALLALLRPFVQRHRDLTAATVQHKLDIALLFHEENAARRARQ